MSWPSITWRNQTRSTSAICRTSPSRDKVDGGLAARRRSSSDRSSHFKARVARWKSRYRRSISRSFPVVGGFGRSVVTLGCLTCRFLSVRSFSIGRVDLPVMPPVRPMLAKAVHEVPRTAGLLYEPKWDGFRCIVFRDGDEVELGSRNDRPLTRYFPELVELLREALPPRCVVDGEIVVVTENGLDFDTLQNRLHPAASRVRKLAGETPASFVAFDLLALDDRDLTGEPFRERRRVLEDVLGDVIGAVLLTPVTVDPDMAQDWFVR